MDQQQILARITDMVDAEKTLRESLASGAIDETTERARLSVLERELDQCWDLLRRRRAKEEFGGDPDTVRVRPAAQVEGYQS
ncbi:DUF2630 family protein [Streptomyces flavofungini]|uniref:DUF2630 family protein n=1 Tax=Streptomyces flavofungini TaxID=68200 RepID=A0ABS0XBX9_9ACTN|nr:DUF2630 family protein [Streptomyces flavofungini]MBJ3810723.1 DUF2630 family protein [Streptomyces flavofungini]GHC51763.1 hypothetical protein GCM10010349_17070 [Streptomyces flavofungini]